MPKYYETNGISAKQIKKKYTPGITAKQIKKLYAMVGTTAKLVYSAADYIFQSGEGAIVPISWKGYQNGFVEIGTDSIHSYSTSSGSYTHRSWWTPNAIDLTNYKKLCFKILATTMPRTQQHVLLGIVKSTGQIAKGYISETDSSWLKRVTLATLNEITTVEIDLTNVTGNGYICLYSNSGSPSYQDVYDVWLEQ